MSKQTFGPGTWALLAAVVVVGAVGAGVPSWQFMLTVALGKGVVAMGVALLLRSGLASFGQALYYAVGAYTIGLATNVLGWHELAVLLPAAALAGGVLAFVLGFLLSRYRDIFFAMLTLALSMIVYGLLMNTVELGGSDGFNVHGLTLLGLGAVAEGAHGADGGLAGTALFGVVFGVSLVALALVAWFMRTRAGRLGPAIRDNEIRVEYLGTSARANIHLSYVIAGALGGLGGALSSFTIGHIDPDMAFWTTSGDFIFIAVLSGTGHAFAPFVGAILLEVVRSMAYQYAPNSWHIVMGVIMLAIIAFLPTGLTSLRLGRKKAAEPGGAPQASVQQQNLKGVKA